MTTGAGRFYSTVADAEKLTGAARIDLFVYYLTEVLGLPAATPKDVEACFREADLAVPGSVSATLSKGLKSKPKIFVKVGRGGYR